MSPTNESGGMAEVEDEDWKPKHTVLIGVIGGIGPAASAKLYQNVVELRKNATRDADHVQLLIYNNPQIPNNNEAVIGKGPPSLPAMVYTARALERAGATHIVMPCNTAHVFAQQLQERIRPLQFIHMLELTARTIMKMLHDKYKNEKAVYRVGLMGTVGTLQSGVYHKVFSDVAGARVEVISPSESSQQNIQACIGRVKAGEKDSENVKELLLREAQLLIHQGADIITLGCTEIPLVLTPEQVCRHLSAPVVDPMYLLALEIIRLSEQGL